MIFLDHCDGKLPPPKNSPTELLIFNPNHLKSMSYEYSNVTSFGYSKYMYFWTNMTKEMKKKREKYKEECCIRKFYFLHCERRIGVNSSLFDADHILLRDNITIHGIYFMYKKNLARSAYVYVNTENGEEALIYHNIKTGNFRGSGIIEGRSFAFHKCLGMPSEKNTKIPHPPCQCHILALTQKYLSPPYFWQKFN